MMACAYCQVCRMVYTCSVDDGYLLDDGTSAGGTCDHCSNRVNDRSMRRWRPCIRCESQPWWVRLKKRLLPNKVNFR